MYCSILLIAAITTIGVLYLDIIHFYGFYHSTLTIQAMDYCIQVKLDLNKFCLIKY